MPKRRRSRDPPWADSASAVYSIEGDLRHVEPYYYTYSVFVKRRWINRTILDVFCDEFIAFSASYYEEAIKNGRITVNGITVDCAYSLKDNDLVEHRTHRHEPPTHSTSLRFEVHGEIVAVNKPSSLPMHPSGSYHFNSLVCIMSAVYNITLYPVHRLDRLTSGLVVMALNPSTASRLSKEIRDRDVQKVYLARVSGRFPSSFPEEQRVSRDIPTCELVSKIDSLSASWMKADAPIVCTDRKIGRHAVNHHHEDSKRCKTLFRALQYDEKSDTTVVLCRPLTGRTHQIRVHLQWLGFPIANDPCYGGALCGGNIQHHALKGKLNPALFDSSCPMCRHCDEEKDNTLYCNEIWLHALQYSGETWSYNTELPAWSQPTFDAKIYLSGAREPQFPTALETRVSRQEA